MKKPPDYSFTLFSATRYRTRWGRVQAVTLLHSTVPAIDYSRYLTDVPAWLRMGRSDPMRHQLRQAT